MAIAYVDTLRNTRMDDVDADVNGGGGAGKIRIYSGTVPDGADGTLSATTVLAELAMSATAFGAASGGVITANSISDDTSADATGVASFFRILDNANVAVVQGTVGTSGADLNLSSVSLTATDNVSISSFTITEGNA